MAEFQWWLLLVGLVAGGGLVAVVTMDGRRREDDVLGLERRAEATWIAERTVTEDGVVDPAMVEEVLRLHREYLGLPPPDEIIIEADREPLAVVPAGDAATEDEVGAVVEELDRDADQVADEVGDRRRGGADEDLPAT
jgi:bifunctional DNA-binding transcriptional regulator/antitoxin component of YhaV-PrlF toxin-antitoxin module